MINQIFYYNLEIFSLNNITISFNALILIVLFFVTLFINNKYFKIFNKLIYLIIIIGVLKVLIFQEGTNSAIESGAISKISYFLYNIINYPISSMHTYFMAYSYLFIIIFIPFSFIFKEKKFFISFILIIELLKMFYNLLGIGNEFFSFYNIFLYIIGYLIGYLIKKIIVKEDKRI